MSFAKTLSSITSNKLEFKNSEKMKQSFLTTHLSSRLAGKRGRHYNLRKHQVNDRHTFGDSELYCLVKT